MKRTPLRCKTTLKAKTGLKRTKMKRKGRKPPTAAQQRRHDAARELGCIIDGCCNPAAIHHIREGLGMGQAVDHDRILNICYDHHQSEAAGAISIQGAPKEFKEMYGTETELEKKLKERLNANGYFR